MLRLVFMGTAELAAVSLRALTEVPDWQIVGVVTQPDKPRGRDLQWQPPPVKVIALEKGFPVFQPVRARDEALVEALQERQPDLIVVAAYGQILPPSILDLPKYKCLNVHTSLLPKYRGAAPIQWAILDGETETGVTIMQMDAGLDTGDIVATERTLILPGDNAETLHDRLAEMGARLLVATIPLYLAGKLTPQKQPAEGFTYARKITKEDGWLDWSLPARVLGNRIRGFTPWPGAFTFYSSGGKPRLLKIWQAEVVETAGGAPGQVLQADRQGIVVGCGQQALRILLLQKEGGRRLAALDFLAGNPLPPGTCFLANNG